MNKMISGRPAALILLTGITAIWGWSFVIVKDSISVYPVFSFLSLRFFLGSLILLPFLGRSLIRMDKRTAVAGSVLGAFLFSGYAFQTTGLIYTTPSHSGFITGLFVVFTPLIEAFLFKKKPSAAVIFSLALSTSGLFILSYDPDLKGINYGDFLSLVCALIYSFHLIMIDRFSKRYNTMHLAFLQIFTVSVLSFFAVIVTGSSLLPVPDVAARGIVLTAMLATALSYYIQTTYQKATTATEAALIFTLEPIFAGIFAYFMWSENISMKTLFGGVLIFTGMVISQVRYFFFQGGGKLVDEQK